MKENRTLNFIRSWHWFSSQRVPNIDFKINNIIVNCKCINLKDLKN